MSLAKCPDCEGILVPCGVCGGTHHAPPGFDGRSAAAVALGVCPKTLQYTAWDEDGGKMRILSEDEIVSLPASALQQLKKMVALAEKEQKQIQELEREKTPKAVIDSLRQLLQSSQPDGRGQLLEAALSATISNEKARARKVFEGLPPPPGGTPDGFILHLLLSMKKDGAMLILPSHVIKAFWAGYYLAREEEKGKTQCS